MVVQVVSAPGPRNADGVAGSAGAADLRDASSGSLPVGMQGARAVPAAAGDP